MLIFDVRGERAAKLLVPGFEMCEARFFLSWSISEVGGRPLAAFGVHGSEAGGRVGACIARA